MIKALRFEDHGAERLVGVIASDEVVELRDQLPNCDGPGLRLSGVPAVTALAGTNGVLGKIAAGYLGSGTRPVRAILFDKNADSNWGLGWHQDRTIAVRERCEVPGFGPWTVKAGVAHVEPPFPPFERMVTLRLHLDPCGEENAPLLIAPGSHRQGKVPAGDAGKLARELGFVTCLAEAGDVWVYATPILHASAKAAVPSRRRVLHVDYAHEDLPGGLEWAGI